MSGRFLELPMAGVTKIFLTGYTPQPMDRFGRELRKLSKVALGGEHSVIWEYKINPLSVIKNFKAKYKKGLVIGIEQDKKSIDYKKVKIKYPALFIVGNEVEGISKNILKLCDEVVEIPMKGKKESLNVSVSCGIALFRMLNI